MSPDEAAIGAVLDAMYAMISGPAGPRDWRRQPEIFHPDCRQIRTGVDPGGAPWMAMFTPEQYRANADAMLANVDFHEVETARELRIFGNIAHAWSTYEARHAPDDAEPERRGINSIQLYRDVDTDGDGQARWRILHMIWDNERPGLRIPAAG
ncbi:hypothetical protein ACYX7E_04535 [Luteimonas sp. RIT-PG2_3]